MSVRSSHHLFSGASSGLASALILQPLDLLKTRVQQVDGVPNHGILSTARTILAKDGPQGLWRGTVPTLLRNVPGVALYFYTLQSLRQGMTTIPYFAPSLLSMSGSGSVLPKLSTQANLIAGATSRVAVGLLLNPVTVIKARFESDIYAYKNMGEALRSIVRTSGPAGLLQGFSASALRDAPYAGLFVMSYEFIKDESFRIVKPTSATSNGLILSFSSASAAILASVATHPFDMIKTNMQLRPTLYPTLFKAITLIGKERGVLGYLDGITLRLGKKVLSSAISWTVYESFLVFLRS